MLIIRREQLKVFDERSRENFIEDTAKYLRSEYPDACTELGPDGLREMIRNALNEARRREIASRGAVMMFVELQLVFGEGFQLSPDRMWAEKILAHPTLPDYAKMQAVHERLTGRSAGRVVRRGAGEPEDSQEE